MDNLFDFNNYWAAALNFIRNNLLDMFIIPSFLIFFCFVSNTSFPFPLFFSMPSIFSAILIYFHFPSYL